MIHVKYSRRSNKIDATKTKGKPQIMAKMKWHTVKRRKQTKERYIL